MKEGLIKRFLYSFGIMKRPEIITSPQPFRANITPETNAWNQLALAEAAKVMAPRSVSQDTSRRLQEIIYAQNQIALDYAAEERKR